MNKKEITTLIVTGVLVFLVAIFGCYSLAKAPSDDSNDTPNSSANSKDSVKAGNYTLRYGNYAGTSTEYDPDTNKTTSSETIIILQKDKIVIGGTPRTYTIEGSCIKVDGSLMINVTGNDTFVVEAGAGVEYKYQED